MHSFAIPTWHHTFIEIVDYNNIKLNQQLMVLVSFDAIYVVYYYYRFEFLYMLVCTEMLPRSKFKCFYGMFIRTTTYSIRIVLEFKAFS